MDDLKQLAALTALNEMMASNYFSICTIDKIAQMLGVNPKGEAYNVLHTLHCIDWAKMPQPLREAVPGLIQQCLSIAPAYQFKGPPTRKEPELRTIIDVPIEQKPKRGLLRLLGR